VLRREQFTVYSNGGNDTFTIRPRDAAGNSTIGGNIGIIGGPGSDVMTIDDSGSAMGTTWFISNPFGTTTQDFSTFGGALISSLNDVEIVNLRGSPWRIDRISRWMLAP
jgi:hypothetical protein